jgi:hypothetical protein
MSKRLQVSDWKRRIQLRWKAKNRCLFVQFVQTFKSKLAEHLAVGNAYFRRAAGYYKTSRRMNLQNFFERFNQLRPALAFPVKSYKENLPGTVLLRVYSEVRTHVAA